MVIGGGFSNRITPTCEASTIAGGRLNFIHIDSANAAIGGGLANSIQEGALSATIPGGESNVVGAAFSLAAGRRAVAVHSGSLVWGDSTDASIRSTNANSWTVRASGGVRFFSNSNATMGVILNAGEGAWSVMSDRNAKTNFAAVNSQEVLRRVVDLPVQTWSYKEQPCVRHVGPMAQDFAAAFKVGANDTHITTVDADGVALAAIQGLNSKLEQELKQRDREIQVLRQSVAELTELTEKLAIQGGLRR